jgi:ribose 5-phosphate isomerase B
MKLWIAADHGGFELKESLKKNFPQIQWEDLGTYKNESVDYPLYAQNLCQKIIENTSDQQLLEPCGVLLCGSGVGVSIAANRIKKIRAVLAWNSEVAALSRQHNASNVLCMGGRLINLEEASTILTTWLKTPFEGGRHERRILQIENKG